MVSWIDVLPTLIDIGGGHVPDDLDGRSFASLLLREGQTHRDRIFTTHTGDGIKNIFPIRSVRTPEWKLIHNLHPEFAHTNHSDLDRKPLAGAYWHEWARQAHTDERARQIIERYFRRPEFELYHVTQDKWELENLANLPQHAERLAELKHELTNWRRQQHDTGVVHSKPRLLSEPTSWHPDHFQPPASAKSRRK